MNGDLDLIKFVWVSWFTHLPNNWPEQMHSRQRTWKTILLVSPGSGLTPWPCHICVFEGRCHNITNQWWKRQGHLSKTSQPDSCCRHALLFPFLFLDQHAADSCASGLPIYFRTSNRFEGRLKDLVGFERNMPIFCQKNAIGCWAHNTREQTHQITKLNWPPLPACYGHVSLFLEW